MVRKSVQKSITIYVEGGGNHNPSLVQDARQGFHVFLARAGFEGKLPSVVPCGGRQSTYEDYYTAVSKGIPAILLIDSEAPINPSFEDGDIHDWKPWEQLKNRTNQAGDRCDNWEKVGEDVDCHLMVQEMESWFLSDIEAVKSWFDPKFKDTKFPSDGEDIEKITKEQIERIFKAATVDTTKKSYDKGRDSFNILGRINPIRVKARSKWAYRFLTLLNEKILSLQ